MEGLYGPLYRKSDMISP